MPPPPGSTPPLENSLRLIESTAQNTRVLLRQLEELRDSLTARLEQLSNAVERLRSHATELERLLERNEFGLQSLSLTGDSAINDQDLPHQMPPSVNERNGAEGAGGTRTPVTLPYPRRRAPSAMSANELVPPIATSDPARPVSAAEIEVVLNRASEASITARDRRLTTDQTSVSRDFRPYALSLDDAWRQAIYTTSDDHTSSRLLEEGPFLASVDDNMNETLPGATEDWAAFLRRRHARRLRREARDAYEAVLRNQTSLYPAADGVPADRPATRGFVTDRGRRTAVPDAPGSGGYRLLVDLQARMRSDMRVERPRSISPGTRVGDASRNARRALPLGKPHQGMQPTNLAENLANQPIIVKSTPPSPASTAPRSRICDIYPTRGIPRDIEDMDPGRATPFRSSGDDRTFDIPEDETEPADGGHGHSFVIPPRSDSEDDSDDSASSSTSEGSGGTAIYWHPPSTLGRSLRDLPDSALTARGRRVANRQAAAAEADRAQPDDVERSNTRRTVSLGLQNESPDVARTILDIVTRIHANRPQAVPPPAAADLNEDFDERFDVVPEAETHPVTAAEILDRVDSSERLRSLAQEIIRHTPRTPSSLSRQYPTTVVSAINAGFDFWTPPPPPLTSEPEPTADIFISAAGRAHTAQNLDLDVARERIRSLAQLRRDMSTVRSGGWIRVPDAGSVPGPGSMPVAPPVDNSVPTPEVQGGSDAAGSEPHLHSTRDRAVMFRRMLERAEIEIDEMIATNASSGTVGDTALAPTSTATVATTAADVDGNGDETAEPKTTVRTAVGVSGLVEESRGMNAHLWPGQAGRAPRSSRPYISMLDLD